MILPGAQGPWHRPCFVRTAKKQAAHQEVGMYIGGLLVTILVILLVLYLLGVIRF